MKKIISYILIAIGSWMLISPQSLMGIKYLRWMHNFAFPGEILCGITILAAAYYFLDIPPKQKKKDAH